MRGKRKNKGTAFAWLVSAPMVVYLICILVFPMLWGFYMSFTNKTIGNPESFVGFKNYARLLGDEEYRRAVLNTVVFTAASIFIKTVLGMMMALALNQKFKGRNLVRALLMIPWTLPNIVVVYNWRWIFNSTGGIANYILKSLHIIDADVIWFGSASLAMITIIVANVWRGTPFFGISILAKLQTIPKDYYEAAEIDGAGMWQKFLNITLPGVKDVTILSALMSTIWTINEFETVWLLTGGGPNGTTEVMNVYSYKTAMRSGMIGRGIAVAVLAMPLLMILISIITRRMLPSDERPKGTE